MHLKAMLLKLLPWQPRVEKSLFQFLPLDNSLKIETLKFVKILVLLVL